MTTKTSLSNVDVVRRFVFEKGPVTLEQVGSELRAQMTSIRSDADAREKYALPVLRGQGYYAEKNGAWDIVIEAMPEYKVLNEVLTEQKALLYERDVKSAVAKKLGWKVANVVLDLSRAGGLKRWGSRWGLASWVLLNEEAAEVLKLHPGGLSEKDLLKHVCDRAKVDPNNAILSLEGDKRFGLEKKLWVLNEVAAKRRSATTKEGPKVPKAKSVELELEGSFILAQATKGDAVEGGEGERLLKSRLRKAQIKQAQEIIEQREDLVEKKEDFAARMTQLLSAAGVNEQGVKSFQRVEPASKERGLGAKEREEINAFVSQLMGQETVGTGLSAQAVANAPLSAKKIQDLLRLKYLDYSRDRAIVPAEFYTLLVELLKPSITDTTLHPACYDGLLSTELFSYLFERLDGGAWALVDDNRRLEIVQPDGSRYRIGSEDPGLIEQARDKFIVSQVDLINYYLSNKYTGVEGDAVLAKAARIICRLSGFENAYITPNDFLSELPEIFGYPANESNSIPERFDLVLGNLTFTSDPNLAASFLEQALKLLSPAGRMGVFVLSELLVLMREHGLLGEFLKGLAVTHFIRLPLLEGRHKVVLFVVGAQVEEGAAAKILSAELEDLKAATALVSALRAGGALAESCREVEPLALGTLIH